MNPPPSQWKTQLYPAAAMLTGLALTQAIATIQIYLSNRSLYHTLTAIHGARHLTVPNQQIMGWLQELTTSVFLILGRWMKPGGASLASAILCFSTNLLILMPLWRTNHL
ncbi:MAG: hypothetical protein JRD04_08230 [Deltaproteobacteria bacterium]|nr:hypothetical protein [Deltaproteobacteria bacterium]